MNIHELLSDLDGLLEATNKVPGIRNKVFVDYERLTNDYHNLNINGWKISILKHDIDSEPEKIEEYGVTSYPVLFVEKDGEIIPWNQYGGGWRSYEAFAWSIKYTVGVSQDYVPEERNWADGAFDSIIDF